MRVWIGRSISHASGSNKADGSLPAAAYVRMSTDHQKYSTENQLDTMKRYAGQRGFEIVRIFEDTVVTPFRAAENTASISSGTARRNSNRSPTLPSRNS